MDVLRTLAIVAALALSGLPVSRAEAQQSPLPSEPVPARWGAIAGRVTDAAQVPVAHATVTAAREDGSSLRAAIADAEGRYSFSDLPPGRWRISVETEGPDSTPVRNIDVRPGHAARADLNLPARLAQAARSGAGPGPLTTAAPHEEPTVPEALQAPEPGPDNDIETPLANVGDLGWMNGTSREKSPIFDTKFFTPEIRFDVNYLQSTNQPKDHTIVGSTEEFRSGEFQIEQVSFGGDFHWHNVRARFLSMFGMFATTTPRNDASSAVGNWDLQNAYRYFSEASAGYHFDVSHGLNVDAGVFVSYVGLFSYYNYDNWTYQPSFVSSNTPWFFNGLRVQWWPTQNLKIEPWLINGWQSYAKFNSHPGFGGQILWIPTNSLKLVFNTYTIGEDNLASGSGQPANGGDPYAPTGQPNPMAPSIDYRHVHRFHEDDSILYKYWDSPASTVSKAAFSFTVDFGCEYGGGVHCTSAPNQASFLGAMLYNRLWFAHDLYAVTLGGGWMTNPGRYLTLLPPINGATAASGSPYFTENPGQKITQWDLQLNFQYMPRDWITWWTEGTYRHSNVPYWAGSGGVTPPLGNTGAPGSLVCNSGAIAGADQCAGAGGLWTPDLRRSEAIWGLGVLVRF